MNMKETLYLVSVKYTLTKPGIASSLSQKPSQKKTDSIDKIWSKIKHLGLRASYL